ncbi:MAG: transposase mutator type [Actinoallomurus sp.]|jgi:putative transposase|nr:transposase mutator type [Actinoallomurus sp.]
MAVSDSVDPSTWFAEQIGACEPDLLRQMVKTMAEALMSAEADTVCGAGYGMRSEERINRRNGYRERDWDTCVPRGVVAQMEWEPSSSKNTSTSSRSP